MWAPTFFLFRLKNPCWLTDWKELNRTTPDLSSSRPHLLTAPLTDWVWLTDQGDLREGELYYVNAEWRRKCCTPPPRTELNWLSFVKWKYFSAAIHENANRSCCCCWSSLAHSSAQARGNEWNLSLSRFCNFFSHTARKGGGPHWVWYGFQIPPAAGFAAKGSVSERCSSLARTDIIDIGCMLSLSIPGPKKPAGRRSSNWFFIRSIWHRVWCPTWLKHRHWSWKNNLV